MNEKVLKTLEFNKIIDILSEKAISQMGKEKCKMLKPSTDLYEIENWQKETTEASSIILKKGSLPLGGLKNVESGIKRALMGGVLSITELLHIGDFLYVCRKVKNYSKSEGKQESFESIDPYFGALEVVTRLENEISRCILNENEVADDASVTLRDIRRNIKASNDRVKEHLNSIIHSSSYKNMLQDSVITIRSGRYCIPLKQEYRNSFEGLVHDQSSTGATLFIEPMSVVQTNNKIKELHADEKTEIEKILKALSSEVALSSDIMLSNLEILINLDFIFAKAELSLSMNGTRPVFNEKKYINIKKARHPLLNKDTVVPTDIYLGKDFTMLLITGPNTGGKTVTLKTIGLFTLMGQAGLHIAAFDNSELSVFSDVFADIGDEQSIEQSLSTFSSHMTNIVKILADVNRDSLVLLDELGAGTDPTEGAALAIAILRFLHQKNIRSAVTTHYSELKVYALSEEGVSNASCEFDVETLRPTYRLLIGIPGKSNAFAISRRLGLSEDIIDIAKEVLSLEDERFEDIITDLEISRKSVIVEQERAEQFRREAEKLKNDVEKQKNATNHQKEKIIMEAKEEARRTIAQAKEESDKIIREMQKLLSEGSAIKNLEEKRQKLKGNLEEVENDISKLTTPKKTLLPIPKNLKKGDRVFVSTLNQTGIVAGAPDSNGEVLVKAGIMNIKVHISKLSLDESEDKIKTTNKHYGAKVKSGKSMNITTEIDCRGLLVDEALEKVDKYLDDAYLSGLAQVSIIHGKGTGALRAAVQKHLKTHPHVKSFRLGVFGEGETGVTIAELK